MADDEEEYSGSEEEVEFDLSSQDVVNKYTLAAGIVDVAMQGVLYIACYRHEQLLTAEAGAACSLPRSFICGSLALLLLQ